MGTDDPDIDLAKLDFPTDKLAVKDLRRRYPERFDTRTPEHADNEGSIYEKLSVLIACERDFAANTYDQARKRSRGGGLYGDDLKIVRKELARDYITFGLATGPAHAEQ